MFKVKLAARGNPDFGQPSDMGIKSHFVEVADLKAASDACMAFIRENNLGGGNWTGGEVKDAKGNLVARVSYNGRVWSPGKWFAGKTPLLG